MNGKQNKAGGGVNASPVTIKNVRAEPASVPNDGTGRVSLRCSVFSGNDYASVEKVSLDLRHTSLYQSFNLQKDSANTLKATGEGDYFIDVSIPYLSDTGLCRAPLIAEDSAGSAGRKTCNIEILFTRPESMPEIASEEFTHLLERVGGASFSYGNSVEFLDDGAVALQRRLFMIKEAKEQINIQAYTLGHTGAAREILDAVTAKIDQNVELNVLLNADSQLPTSPISAVRLKLNRFFKELTKTLSEDIEKLPSIEDILSHFQNALGPGSGVNMIFFRGRAISQTSAATPGENAQVSHWLMRILRGDLPEIRGIESLEKYIPSFAGPGGLPSLPLLDYAIHEKILTADADKAVVGGRNSEDPYFTRWRDLDLYLEGPIVRDVREGFISSFKEIAEAQNENAVARQLASSIHQGEGVAAMFVQSRPWTRQYRTLCSLICSMQAAAKRIYISSQYIVLPDCLLRDALFEAAGRGVDVRIITNSLTTGREVHMGAGYFVTLNYMGELLEAGIRVYEAKGLIDEQAPQPYLHGKEYIFDGEMTAAGSFNLSLRSSYIESENLVFIHDRDIAEKRTSRFLEFAAKQCAEATPDHVARQKTIHKTKIELASYLELLY